jgi:hypothetical protein
MPSRPQNSLISALLSGRNRRRRPALSSSVCPACGEALAATDHAVMLAGNPYHAGCVLYRRRVSAGNS